ncbi:FliM/FliN family flagellar motor switch protein [Massilia endophytica]|uniref:FliM/FliN family flagellar motor switch protein n=1 Tax=Massilia endophytica TaxID=2899220 RepID=UPI001E2B2D14|nr:FliM/FliN family flagellar motor switch protein [Massilia endophytica]UGQ47976.1 FliM/FliN family flagellar motor switch protein [Massilia endophytica]
MSKNSKAKGGDAALEIIDLAQLPARDGTGSSLFGSGFEVIQNVKARLTVVAGETGITIGELLGLKTEQVLKLESLMDAPVDILLEGQLVARGQLVAVDEHFGVRILELPGGSAA